MSFADIETVTSEPVSFRAYAAVGGAYALTNATDIAAWPITWHSGETVTATAMDGTVYVLADGGSVAASTTLPAAKGGAWTFENSNGERAVVCVPWSVYNDGGAMASGAAVAYGVDSVKPGPDRKATKRSVLPIAYSGDDWAGDFSKAASLKFTPPEGSSLSETTVPVVGTGAVSFAFNAKGVWTVTLTFEDSTVKVAHIDIQSAGLIIIVQ